VDPGVSDREVGLDTLTLHDIGFEETVERIVGWAEEGSGGYVTTPNVDHVVRARRDPAYRELVMGARLRVPDGMGIVYGSRLAGRPLRSTVTGRLLPEAVARRAGRDGPAIALMGGQPGAGERAAQALRQAGGNVAVATSPPMGFAIGSTEDRRSVAAIAESGARIVFVGLGSPKQERWMVAHGPELPGAVMVGIGQGIDVLGGRVRAAPAWMTRIGVEWAFRLTQDPRRLARRYLWDDPRFFWWMLRARLSRG
jgi:N-acetylglucosaminyldiphosphoundecaprenol N-acetyl-beta-D-mannosaminyltransferase